jgi:hypothetical protein
MIKCSETEDNTTPFQTYKHMLIERIILGSGLVCRGKEVACLNTKGSKNAINLIDHFTQESKSTLAVNNKKRALLSQVTTHFSQSMSHIVSLFTLNCHKRCKENAICYHFTFQ